MKASEINIKATKLLSRKEMRLTKIKAKEKWNENKTN